jgi:tetratricopeptide (TPR) repeat protein
VPEDDSDDVSLPDMRQNTFDWSRLDDSGLPELVPLLTALRLESAAADQSSPLDETETEEPSCLRNSELQDISSNGPVSVIDSIDSCLLLYKPESEDNKHGTRNNSPQYPWRSIENVFWGNTTSPLNEIYVFPPSQAPRWTKKANVVNLWACQIEETSKLEMKLAKLEAHFGDHSSAVMAVMEQLSSIYIRLDDYRKAERLKRRLVDIYYQVLGPNDIRTLQAALCVIDILLAQGRFLKAKAESDDLLSSILKLVEPDHPLAVLANHAYARICSGSGESDEAELHYRQHLQVMLSLHGPKALPTIEAMLSLSDELDKKAPKEAEILVRIAAQLVIELPTVDESPCRAFRAVIHKLNILGAYEESYHMATKLLDTFSLPLGDQHPTIWKARDRLAWSMNYVGKLSESIKLFRAVISHQEERYGEIDPSHINSWCGLADALLYSGEVEEACKLYERAFEVRMEFKGANNTITVQTAYRLGFCYCTQNKYVEALNIYGKMINLLREIGNGTRAVRNFEVYMLHTQRLIAAENLMRAESPRQ